ncbi:MAG: M36 family metallopeptidase [Flavobacteriales bacterium]
MYRVIFFILISLSLSAQKTDESNASVFYIDTVLAKHYIFTKTSFPEDERLISVYLEEQLSDLKGTNSNLEFLNTTKSIAGKHYCFIQKIGNIPVYRSMVKVNVLQNKKVIDVVALTFNEENISGSISNANCLFPEDRILIPAIKSKEEHFEILKDLKGELLYYFDQHSYSGKKDTIATLSVFNPDPLTSAQTSYGAPYYDNNDATNSSLDAQLQWKDISLKFENDTFYLENDFYFIKDVDAPNIDVVISEIDTFSFNRSQDGFEDINSFYHLSNERNYFLGLGFPSLVNKMLYIDPHAWSGNENSSFDEFTTPSTLLFGEGGIDDAEDADVVIHEFGHFVSANAAPNSNAGQERKAIDEGFGDYLAVSYSKNINSYNWTKVFNWDGNNGSWQGRSAATTKHYPEDYKGNLWKDGEMWSSALMQINSDLGRATTDSLVFEALYAQSTNTSMVDAAFNLIDADTALFNGKYHNIIYKRLQERGFFETEDSTTTPVSSEILIVNTAEFAKGNALQIILPALSSGSIKLFDSNGKLIEESTFTNLSNIDYNNENIASGVYIIEITVTSQIKKAKLVRTQ